MATNRRRVLAGAAAAAGAFWVPRAQAATVSLKYANSLPPTYPHTVRMREAVDRIRAESNGEVQIEVFRQVSSAQTLTSSARSAPAQSI